MFAGDRGTEINFLAVTLLRGILRFEAVQSKPNNSVRVECRSADSDASSDIMLCAYELHCAASSKQNKCTAASTRASQKNWRLQVTLNDLASYRYKN